MPLGIPFRYYSAMKNTKSYWSSSTAFTRTMKDLHGFAELVEKDPTKYDVGTLLRVQNNLIQQGRVVLTDIGRDFVAEAGSLTGEQAELLELLVDRYARLWIQYIDRAFATARDSVDARDNRGRPRRSIWQRIRDYFFKTTETIEAYGYFVLGDRVWSMNKAINQIDAIRARVKVSSLDYLLDRKVWVYGSQDSTGAIHVRMISPRNFITLMQSPGYQPELDLQKHRERVLSADVSAEVSFTEWGSSVTQNDIATIARASMLRRKTIKAHVLQGGIPTDAIAETDVAPWDDIKPRLEGYVRARTVTKKNGKKSRGIFRVALVTQIKLLTRNVPNDFLREATSLLGSSRSLNAGVAPSQRLIRVTRPGLVPDSSPVCAAVEGRVLTPDAFIFVQMWLQSGLFHPNCRHHIDRNFDETKSTYDGRYGGIITLSGARRLVGKTHHGSTIRKRKRPNAHITHP